MANRNIIVYPDPVLRMVSEEVAQIDEETHELIRDMFEAMDEEAGIGLAAPQLGVLKRIMVVSIKDKNFERLAIINPVISFFSEETVFMEEGCLSIPGVNMDETTIEVSEDPKTISIYLPNYLIFMEGIAIAKYTLASDLRDFLDFKVVKYVDLFDYQETKPTDEESETQDKDNSNKKKDS